MKHTLIMLLFAGTCLADPPQVTLDGLEVPEAVDIEVVVEKIAKSDLPEGLLEVISNYYWGGGNGEVPEKIDFRIVDLNSDQSPEFFAKTFMGGSGGPLYLIFSKTGEHWEYIGESGNFKLLPKKNGWHPIVSFGRSGQHYFKHFSEYRDGLYSPTETHEILNGKVTITKVGEDDHPQ